MTLEIKEPAVAEQLKEWLLGRESDIALSTEDLGDLSNVFYLVIGRYATSEEPTHKHDFVLQNADRSASHRFYRCSGCPERKPYGMATSSNPYECTHPDDRGRTCRYCGSYIRGDELG